MQLRTCLRPTPLLQSPPQRASQMQQRLHCGDPTFPIQLVQQSPQINKRMTTPPSDYLVWSLLGFLCCLWPIGFCAIMASMNVRSAVNRGDMEGAKTFSNVAIGINITNTVAGITFFVVLFTVIIF